MRKFSGVWRSQRIYFWDRIAEEVWGVGRAWGSVVPAKWERGSGNASNHILSSGRRLGGGERPGILAPLYHIWNVDFNLFGVAPFIPPAFENAVIYLHPGVQPIKISPSCWVGGLDLNPDPDAIAEMLIHCFGGLFLTSSTHKCHCLNGSYFMPLLESHISICLQDNVI